MKTPRPESELPGLGCFLDAVAEKLSVSADEAGAADALPASAASCAGAGRWVEERPARSFRKMGKIPIPHWDPRGERATNGRARHKPG
jgi:hypothetical protein